MRDIDKQVSVVSTIAPAAAATATTTGAGVDLQGYRAAMCILHVGVATDGTFTPTLEESDDNSAFTTVAAADLSGSFATVTASTDEVVQEVGYLGTKRYIRLVMTETVASAGCLFSAVIVRGKPITAPV